MSGTVGELVVVDNEVQLQRCTLYRHNPAAATECAILNDHHVCPESWWEQAGKPHVTSPLVSLCPTCHYNVHAAIDARIKGQKRDLLPPRCVSLADQAFTIAAANGLTPALTL